MLVKDEIYSSLNNEAISEKDYKSAQRLLNKLKIKNMSEYQNLNVISQTLLIHQQTNLIQNDTEITL